MLIIAADTHRTTLREYILYKDLEMWNTRLEKQFVVIKWISPMDMKVLPCIVTDLWIKFIDGRQIWFYGIKLRGGVFF